MKNLNAQDSTRRETFNRFRRLCMTVGGCLLVVLIAILFPRHRNQPPGNTSVDASEPGAAANSATADKASGLRRRPGSVPSPPPSAEQIVARKLNQFGRSRRELVHALAKHLKVDVPDDVERFFHAVESGRWEEIDAAHNALLKGGDLTTPRSAELHQIWRAVQET